MGKDETAVVQAHATRGHKTVTVAEKYADETLRIIEDHGDEFGPLTPEKETKLRLPPCHGLTASNQSATFRTNS